MFPSLFFPRTQPSRSNLIRSPDAWHFDVEHIAGNLSDKELFILPPLQTRQSLFNSPCRPHLRLEREAEPSSSEAQRPSVVTRRPATEAASCSAARTTLVRSMMPFEIRLPNSPV
jgi:hypothetical protein